MARLKGNETVNKECIVGGKDRSFYCLYSQVFFGGHVCFETLLERRPWLLEVSERDVEEISRWGRVGGLKFRMRFARGLK